MSRGLTILLLVMLAGCARFQPRPISPSDSAAKLDSRSLENTALKEFLKKNSQQSFNEWPLKSWDFEKLNLAALYYHPSLEVARAQWQVALGGDQTATARPNPTVTATPGYDFSAVAPANPWIPGVSFDFPIETMGKRGYRKDRAAHLTESARLNIATAAWQVRNTLRLSLIDYAAAREREGLLREQLSVQERVVHSQEQQLEAGAISRAELGQFKIALAKVQLDLSDARRQQVDARNRVAEAIGIPVKALSGIDLVYDLAAGPPATGHLVSAQVRDAALKNRPDIRSALAEYAASQSALQLEIAKQYPDIHFGPGYQFDQGDHKFTLSLTAELPVLNQNQGPIAEAMARRAEAAARFIAVQARVMAEIDRTVAVFQIARDNLSVLESLAAEQRKQSEAVEAQAKAGAAAQPELLNSENELDLDELVRLDGRVKLQQAFAALENAMQEPVDALKPFAMEPPPAKKENKP